MKTPPNLSGAVSAYDGVFQAPSPACARGGLGVKRDAPGGVGVKIASHAKADEMEAILLLHIIAAGHKDPSIIVVVAVLLIFAFRREIGEGIFRPTDPKARRPRHWRRR
jgi:hypothetical protein